MKIVVVGGGLYFAISALQGSTLRGSSEPWDNDRMTDRTRQDTSVSTDRHTRAAERSKRIVANRAQSFAAAECWDLEFWQACTPGERLSALVHLRRDVELAGAARSAADDAQR